MTTPPAVTVETPAPEREHPATGVALSAPSGAAHICAERTNPLAGRTAPAAAARVAAALAPSCPPHAMSSAFPDGTAEAGAVTRLLLAARAGDRAAMDRVVALVYDDLRQLARRQLAREHGARELQPTTLVHEAYLKLARHVPRAVNRGHFLAIAAHAMRQVLVDHARERHAAKRGPEWARTTLTGGDWVIDADAESLLTLDAALDRLDPRQRQVVECRFFAGMDDAEIAESLGVTTRTVRRDWVKARAWLNRWLAEASA